MLLAKVPGANECLCKWAELKGVPVIPDPDEEHFDAALDRGLALRARFEKLADRALRFRTNEPEPDDDAEAQTIPS